MKGASEMTEFIRERLEDGKHRQYGEEPVIALRPLLTVWISG